ncbi:tripartite tricarboxylate transporter TctB family protein [Pelagibacterium xiamenense]|uniref:tripartite tricarboxylate transporter TctB family protein n=1 Tax=Pelagibacterium xiamenense TaxID=2901140 RepID=UPI001E427596|nr:tripartite tricarboxylate transporter TctB family protein [Pelagibacterium xiamenense]MCD7059155.1 tripartite tricarboxylate transporter TctB family protein [Pelagibacterium xiamenense]
MDEQTPEPERQSDWMNRADFLTGVAFALLGFTIIYLSWIMPRLEIRGIHPSTVPGLVPGLLGALLAISGILLGAKALVRIRGKAGWRAFMAVFASEQAIRFAVVSGLCLAYALILVGRVPFWLATTLFVFALIVAFEVWLNDAPKPLLRSAVFAAVQAAIVAGLVTAVFQYGFLVRLP